MVKEIFSVSAPYNPKELSGEEQMSSFLTQRSMLLRKMSFSVHASDCLRKLLPSPSNGIKIDLFIELDHELLCMTEIKFFMALQSKYIKNIMWEKKISK